MGATLLECDQVLWVSLAVVEHDKDLRVGNIVHHCVIQNVGLPGLLWGNFEIFCTLREDASQNARQVHAFDTVTIWLKGVLRFLDLCSSPPSLSCVPCTGGRVSHSELCRSTKSHHYKHKHVNKNN